MPSGKWMKAEWTRIKEVLESVDIGEILGWAISDFLVVVVWYGLLIAFAVSVLTKGGIEFSLGSVMAWGIAYYFIKAELPAVVNHCFMFIK